MKNIYFLNENVLCNAYLRKHKDASTPASEWMHRSRNYAAETRASVGIRRFIR